MCALTVLGVGLLGGASAGADTRHAAPGATGAYPCAASDPCSLETALTIPGDDANDEIRLAAGEYHRTEPLWIGRRYVGGPAPGEGSALISIDLPAPAAAVEVTVGEAHMQDLAIRTTGALASLDLLASGAQLERLRVSDADASLGGVALQARGSARIRDTVASSKKGDALSLISIPGNTDFFDLVNVTAVGATRGIRVVELAGTPGTLLPVRLANTIVRGERSDLPDVEFAGSRPEVTTTLEASYSNLGPVEVDPDANYSPGPGLRSELPLFVDSAAGDFHQLAGSPTVDAGTATPAAGLGPSDLDGDPRLAGVAVDVGADELPVPTEASPTQAVVASGASGAPRISRASIAPRKFRVAPRRGRRIASLKLTLTLAARLSVVVQRVLPGVRVHKGSATRCVKPAELPVRQGRCLRFLRIGSLLRRALPAGTATLGFDGWLGGGPLPPGRYRLRLLATSGDLLSRPGYVRFTVLPSAGRSDEQKSPPG